MQLPFLTPCSSPACHFDRAATAPVIVFEIFVVVLAIMALFFLRKSKDRIFLRFCIIAIGVFIFEFFTHPLWINEHMGRWAYAYRDVSWILTVGWSTIVLVSVTAIDILKPRWKHWQRFLLALPVVTFFSLIAETIVVNLGLRRYSPEALEVINNQYIPVIHVPWGTLYYVPVFMALIIAFYRYWTFASENTPIAPRRRPQWLRTLVITYIAVFLYEMMIEPMVVNARFPSWSYVYRDISIILTTLWVVVIWLATNIAERIFIHYSLAKKFLGTIILASIFFFPLEAWMITYGYRLYGPSTVANFSGYKVFFTQIPVEVAFAVPFYLALVFTFVRFWEIALDNRKRL